MSAAGPEDYARLRVRRLLAALLGALSALAVGTLLDVMVGPANLPVADVLGAITGSLQDKGPATVIVREIRLPMTTMAIVVGASLGLAGAQMQTVPGNPLASPYTLGFSAAACFGAALTILVGFELRFAPRLTTPLMAFAGAALAAVIMFGFARIRGVTAEVMVLAGIATLFLFQSLQFLVQYLAAPEVLQEIVFWLFGSMLKASWLSVAVSATILTACTLVCASLVSKLIVPGAVVPIGIVTAVIGVPFLVGLIISSRRRFW